MRIEIRSDHVLLDGYVNAVGRDSKPLITSAGRVVEQIEPRAFERALGRAEDVKLLLNHDPARKLGSIADRNLELFEDNIGLRAVCTITDDEVMRKAREKKLRGWSFGMRVSREQIEQRAENVPRRHVQDLDLFEVSIIDDKLSPCYAGTSIEQRADGGETVSERRENEFRAIIDDQSANTPNYSEFENIIEKLKGAKNHA